MATILVTGAAGFIGSNLVDALLLRGDRVIGVDNFCPVYDPVLKRANLRAALGSPRFVLHEQDIRDQAAVARILLAERPAAVVHLAGRSGAVGSLAEAEDYFASNLDGTQRLLDACRVAGVSSVVLASSMSVYGPQPEPVRESAPLPPAVNAYVASKRLAEETCRAYASVCGMRVTILRISSVYGPRQREEMAISTFARRIEAGEPVPLWGGGRDFVCVDDLAGAVLAALDLGTPSETINVGSGRFVDTEAVVEVLSDLLGRPAAIRRVPPPSTVPGRIALDISLMRERLRFSPGVPLEVGLGRFLAWRRETRTEGTDRW